MITARRRNNLVLIQSKTLVDGQWNQTTTWVQHTQAWVSIDPQRGRETYSSGEVESSVTHVIRGDFMELSGVDATMRIIHAPDMSYVFAGDAWVISAAARVFNILAVMPDFESRGDVMIQAAEKGLRYGDLPLDIPE